MDILFMYIRAFQVIIFFLSIIGFFYHGYIAIRCRSKKLTLIALIPLIIAILLPIFFSKKNESIENLEKFEQEKISKNVYVIKNGDDYQFITQNGTINCTNNIFTGEVKLYESDNCKEPTVKITTYTLQKINGLFTPKYEIVVPKGTVFIIQ
ncbi:MAG: hypothetical protein Q4G05_04330 [Clostridia bacterium]|nr:hypothetical protein [Clostridia bacterium]